MKSALSDLAKEEGEILVQMARKAIEMYLKERVRITLPADLPKRLLEGGGAFVSLYKVHPEKELRGCIGYPVYDGPLAEAVINSAISAAVDDPRFEPIEFEEMSGVVVEVSALTEPELVVVDKATQYPSAIHVGRDGLIVKSRYGSGLLLPQVPVEYSWDAEEFLNHVCMKAGAPPDCWLLPETKIYRFRSVIYSEVTPRGQVVLRNLKEFSPKR